MHCQTETISPFENTTADSVYKAVGSLHVDLSDDERTKTIKHLGEYLDLYETELLSLHTARVHIYNLFNTKVINEKVVSTLSRDFNMSIHGHNAKLEDRLQRLIPEAFKFDKEGKPLEAIETLKGARFKYSILLEMVDLVKACVNGPNPHAKKALIYFHYTESCRLELFNSIVKLATFLAKKLHVTLSGDIITEEDLIHESLLAAKEAVANYQPVCDGKTFISFTTNWINGTISKYVNENTRTVAIPRTIIDRYRPVMEAMDILGESASLKTIAVFATDILRKKKNDSNSRQLKENEIYTEEEVFKLLQIMQDTASLDIEVNTDRSDDPTTLGERLVSDLPSQEVSCDSLNVNNKLMSLIKEQTSDEEYLLMKLRWGGSKVLGLKQTAELYRRETNKPMNKGKVAEIERNVLQRLRESVAAGDNRLLEIKEVIQFGY
jgi:DNA-directed RNA polymerase sigma subunit (sigma70/sigma32)